MPEVTLTKHCQDGLDWPTTTTAVEEGPPTISIECAGPGFFEFQTLWENPEKVWEELLAADRDDDDDEEEEEKDLDALNETLTQHGKSPLPMVDLFSLSELELQEIDYYQVLHLRCLPSITPDDVKKAYRKACLIYHPDKSGRGEEDAVFLKVKTAFETLSTSKLAYDSTEMPFDESVPSAELKAASDGHNFFDIFGPAFERNLHFDARLLPPKQQPSGKRNSKKKSSRFHPKKPPTLGDADSPIDKVHDFYDYWTHFESWRDFTLQASRELETEEHLENAESRYEKRWYQKEIDRHAKKLKQQEIARITTLVERAMAVDPRLIQERKRIVQEKKEKERKREQEALEREQAKEEARKAEEKRIEEEKQRKADEKVEREKEKKQLRKVKQAFRKQVSGALEELLEKEYALEDEVDMICGSMDRLQLSELSSQLDTKSAPEIVSMVRQRSQELENGSTNESGSTETPSNGNSSTKQESSNNTNNTNASSTSSTKTKVPFTKEELSALAKGIKKYPPGGANRWDQIAMYINNLCRPDDPRTKEECIETFNRINNSSNKASKTTRNGNNSAKAASTPAPSVTPAESPKPAASAAAPEAAEASTSNVPAPADDSGWTAEQDQNLQSALATYPATMDKNERWTSIAKSVKGKSKKECVQRFKEIRNAIKEAQKN